MEEKAFENGIGHYLHVPACKWIVVDIELSASPEVVDDKEEEIDSEGNYDAPNSFS